MTWREARAEGRREEARLDFESGQFDARWGLVRRVGSSEAYDHGYTGEIALHPKPWATSCLSELRYRLRPRRDDDDIPF